MDPISIGLIGCGGMGRRHLRAYSALADVSPGEFDLVAVCDPRPDAADQAADLAEQLLGTRPRVFTTHQELIGSGIAEAVDVVTDPSAHHLIAGLALQSGLHVTCEKPLGITVRACREILDAVRPGVVLSTAENYRRDGPNRLARRVLDSGLLGHVHARGVRGHLVVTALVVHGPRLVGANVGDLDAEVSCFQRLQDRVHQPERAIERTGRHGYV